jgi:hypothetical protein
VDDRTLGASAAALAKSLRADEDDLDSFDLLLDLRNAVPQGFRGDWPAERDRFARWAAEQIDDDGWRLDDDADLDRLEELAYRFGVSLDEEELERSRETLAERHGDPGPTRRTPRVQASRPEPSEHTRELKRLFSGLG